MRLIGIALFVRRWRAPLFPGKPSCGHVVMEAILFTLSAEGKCKIIITIGAWQNSQHIAQSHASQGRILSPMRDAICEHSISGPKDRVGESGTTLIESHRPMRLPAA